MKTPNKLELLNLLNSLKFTYLNGNTTVVDAIKDQKWLSITFDQPFLLIAYITDSSLDIETDNAKYRVEPGQVLMIPAHTKYKINLHGQQFTTHWLNLNVSLFEHIDLFSHIKTPNVASVSIGKKIAQLHAEITSLMNTEHTYADAPLISLFQIKRIIYSLLEIILSITEINTTNVEVISNIQRFHPVLSYIENHLAEKIKVSQLAELMFLSTSHFYKEFKEAFHISPMQYISEQRLKKAQYLLAVTDLTIGEIGHEVGYDNAYPFIRFFKSMYGSSPGHYKKTVMKSLHSHRVE